MDKLLLSLFASSFLTLPVYAETLSCISRNQTEGQGYEVFVENSNSLEAQLRGRVVVPAESFEKYSVPAAGGLIRNDYVSKHLHLIVSSKTSGDHGYFSTLSIRGKAEFILLYCAKIGE